MASEHRLLKRNHARSVWLESTSEGEARGARVIKVFRHPSLAQRLRDRGRARREYELLRELSARGLAVPTPLRIAKTAAGWQVEMQAIAGAVSVHELLEGRARWPVARERALRALGRLLAELQAAGLDSRDLHAGNALIDSDGKAWAVDFDKARMRTSLAPDILKRDLIALEGPARERLAPALRARFYAAWLRALPRELRAGLGDARALAREIAARARSARREEVVKQARRWLRDSSVCQRVRAGGHEVLLRAGLPREVALACVRLAREPEKLRAELEALVRAPVVVLHGHGAAQQRRCWLTAGRLEEHRIPAARPLVWLPRPRGVACFFWPREEGAETPDLCALLAHRGLALPPSSRACVIQIQPGPWALAPVQDLLRRSEPAAGHSEPTGRGLTA